MPTPKEHILSAKKNKKRGQINGLRALVNKLQ